MDFDKLKKAARETLKIVSSKQDEKVDEPENIEGEAEDVSPTKEDDNMEITRRVDLRNMLDIFKKKKFTAAEQDNPTGSENETADASSEPISETKSEPVPETDSEPTDEEPIKTDADRSIADLRQALDALGAKLDAAADKDIPNVSELNDAISDLGSSISELYAICTEDKVKQSDLSDAILLQLSDTDKKIKNISNSISGISKLGDSIFDLKNSQMNTKNALGDLEASFYRLKKKMTSSVLIISILTAVIAILEIINLLS